MATQYTKKAKYIFYQYHELKLKEKNEYNKIQELS